MFDLCHVRGTLVGTDQLQMDLSPSNSIIVITPLYLIIPNVPHCRLDVRSLVPPNSIDVRLDGYQ